MYLESGTGNIDKKPVLSDVLGDMVSDNKAAHDNYREHIDNHFGKTKGAEIYEQGRVVGENWERGIRRLQATPETAGGNVAGVPDSNRNQAGPGPAGNGTDTNIRAGGQNGPAPQGSNGQAAAGANTQEVDLPVPQATLNGWVRLGISLCPGVFDHPSLKLAAQIAIAVAFQDMAHICTPPKLPPKQNAIGSEYQL
jgi:hypothetical protein